MKLKDLLHDASKAQLQGLFLHWFPGREVLSARERLVVDLQDVMADHQKVRQRFDALPRSQRAFITSLLVREGFSGTVEEARSHKHGRGIEDFEVEGILKSLQEAGYIVKTRGSGGYASEVFSVPEELAGALRKTLVLEARHPREMLSLRSSRASEGYSALTHALEISLPEARRGISELSDATLRHLVDMALDDRLGILTHSAAGEDSLNRPAWRRELEAKKLGTTGVLSLKDYGIDLEEEGLIIDQELAYAIHLDEARRDSADHDREVSMGADLIIDVDRALEVLRSEVLELTREGNVYKKIEERIAGQFVTTHHPELHEGSPVGDVVELCRKLQLFEEEGQRIALDPLRRRVWRKKPLLRKVAKIFEAYRGENRGSRWSFHQVAIRDIFLDHLRHFTPGEWLVARPLFSAVINKYLLGLEQAKVASEYHERCAGDFHHETLVVPLQKLYHDLSYWVLHRLALLGVVDVAYQDGAFRSLRLSRLGKRLFELLDLPDAGAAGANGAPQAGEPTPNGAPGLAAAPHAVCGGRATPESAQILINPDFEILIYPEAPEEASWMVSFFADRIDSERVKRYRLSRDSVKRGIVSGVNREEILGYLESNVRGAIPPNVVFSLREWTEGVELVRRQKVTVLRAANASGAARLAEILERQDVPFERLNETTIMVRGTKSERALDELQQSFQDTGLFVE